jgi:hypothetical protein
METCDRHRRHDAGWLAVTYLTKPEAMPVLVGFCRKIRAADRAGGKSNSMLPRRENRCRKRKKAPDCLWASCA